jgi:hypothetical protein
LATAKGVRGGASRAVKLGIVRPEG